MKSPHRALYEGIQLAGTHLYNRPEEAVAVAQSLGLDGAHEIHNDEGIWWMPGHNTEEFIQRLYGIGVSVAAHVAVAPKPVAHDNTSTYLTFVKKATT
jgi:hypothetical protein